MTTSTFGKTLTATLVALVLVATSVDARAAQSRKVWTYHNGAGSFAIADSPGQWVEKTHLNTVYTFTEVNRTAAFIELHDASRNLSVRIREGACFIKHSGTNGRFILLYDGCWSR